MSTALLSEVPRTAVVPKALPPWTKALAGPEPVSSVSHATVPSALIVRMLDPGAQFPFTRRCR